MTLYIRPVLEYPGPGTDPLTLYTRMALTVNQLIGQVAVGGGTVTHSTGNLTANHLILGNGSGDIKALSSLGTTTTVLHGNAAGAPSFGAVSLTADVSGTLGLANGGLGSTTGAGTIAAANQIATDESTNSVTYTDLATTGPSVTLTTGTAVIVWIGSGTYATGTGNTGFVSIAVSGATTVAATDANSSFTFEPTANMSMVAGRVVALTGLTAGSNTFTLKYRVDSGTFHFRNRSIAVLAL